MKYDKYFTIIIIISSLSGIFIGILSNNIIDPNKIENQTKNTKKDNTELTKSIIDDWLSKNDIDMRRLKY